MSILTVEGPFEVPDSGVLLIHEHLYIDLSYPLDRPDLILRDVDYVAAAIKRCADQGLRLVVDATTVEMGRNPWALRDIAKKSGVAIVAPTGRYRQAAMPKSFGSTSVDELAELFVAELRKGIDGGDIRAGIIGEIGTNLPAFTEAEHINFVASGLAQHETGAPVLVHTPGGKFGVEQAKLLIESGADPSKICIGHIDCYPNLDYYSELYDLGVWLGMDRAGSGRFVSDSLRIAAIQESLRRGWGDRILMSGDVAARHRIDSDKGYDYSFTDYWTLINGSDERTAEYDEIFRKNPARYLSWDA